MLPALNIPALISPLCPSLPLTFSSATAKQRHKRYHLLLGCVQQYLSLPLPLPFPLPVLSNLPCPLHILCSIPFPCPFLTALRVLLTLAIVIVIAIARTAPSTARHTGIRPVVIIIILVDYLIPIQWSNGKEVAWFVLPTASRFNLCPEIIPTVPRETLTSAINLPRAGCLQIGAIDLIPASTGIVPPPIVHLVAGFVKHLPHI
jgi:hypothetical protein